MSKLSEKRFLENHSSFPDFYKKSLKYVDVKWSLLLVYLKDYNTANS